MIALAYIVTIMALLAASIYWSVQVLLHPMFWVLILCGILYGIGGWWLLVPCAIVGIFIAGVIADNS